MSEETAVYQTDPIIASRLASCRRAWQMARDSLYEVEREVEQAQNTYQRAVQKRENVARREHGAYEAVRYWEQKAKCQTQD